MLFGLGILATALLLSVVAAYYSVAGLTAIFSAAVIPVIIMGASLELGKIVATVWLHNNWRRAGIMFKLYLIPAVAFLMLLTSMGIFGYLSKAHSDQNLVSGDSLAKIAIYDEKIKVSKDNIDVNRRALKQMDEAVDQVMGRSTDEKGADKAVQIRRTQQRERARLLKEIDTEQKTISQLLEERAPLAAENRKIEAEVGPIKYIAALIYGDNPDQNILERAVRWVIIMIVLVFDPLALTLILAANKQFEWARRGHGGWVHDDDRPAMSIVPPAEGNKPDAWIADVGEPPTEQEKKEIEALNQDPHPPGWMFTRTNNEQKEPESLLEQHPYLNKGFPHFKNLEPVVAQPEDESDEEPETNQAIKTAIKKWKSQNPNDTIKNQRYKFIRGEIKELPWMQLIADNNISPNETKSGFGINFPTDPTKGDTFVRVDSVPSILYKYNGSNWIVVDKNLTDSYTYNTAYIDHLIEKIDGGHYDPDLLSESEREQVTQRLQSNTNT